MNNGTEFKHPPLLWWILWAALLSGIFVMYFVGMPANGRTPGKPASADSAIWMVSFAPFTISAIVRWIILPRLRYAAVAFPAFIVGLAMAEMPCILGFVFPTHELKLFLLSVLGIVQFAPYFADRFGSPEG